MSQKHVYASCVCFLAFLLFSPVPPLLANERHERSIPSAAPVIPLPDGQHCLVIGRQEGVAQPILFVFQGSIDGALAEPLYTEVARLLAADGVLSVVLDAPAHGADAVPGEPPELSGWVVRLRLINRVVGGITPLYVPDIPDYLEETLKTLREHQRIHDAIARRDSREATIAMEAHIQDILDHSIKRMRGEEASQMTALGI